MADSLLSLSELKNLVRTIPDFPHAGIQFRDITTLLADAQGLKSVIHHLAARYREQKIDVIAGVEARGFILGAALAYELGIGFVPLRKKGKLPGKTVEQSYSLEYGSAIMEVHEDAFERGSRVLIIDDLMATGGTAECAIHLVEKIGGEVLEVAVVIDLPELAGSQRLKSIGHQFFALIDFEGH